MSQPILKSVLLIKGQEDPIEFKSLIEHFVSWLLLEDKKYIVNEDTFFSGIELRLPIQDLEEKEENLAAVLGLLVDKWTEFFEYDPVKENLTFTIFGDSDATGKGYIALYEPILGVGPSSA